MRGPGAFCVHILRPTQDCVLLDYVHIVSGMQHQGFVSQIWYEWAVLWRRGADEHSSAHECAVLKQAAAALPDCVMLSFALADALEATGKHSEALKVFEVCSSPLQVDLDSGQADGEVVIDSPQTTAQYGLERTH